MAFEQYVAATQGFRAREENCIALGKSRIGLGTYKLPWEYAVIYFDRENPAIMFVEGHKGNGFKVQKLGKNYFLSAQSSTKLKYIPLRIYKSTDDKAEVFRLVEHQNIREDKK